MGTLASGSIDLKSLKVAGEPNKYITYIDNTGIRVHEAGAENTNFIQINSTGMSIYTGGQAESNKIAEFKSYITLGTRATSSVIGNNSIAMGTNVAATGTFSMATGHSTTASGNYSHAEGWGTTASGNYSHAEGSSGQLDNEDLIASGAFSHAEGFSTQAAGRASHAGGQYSIAANDYSFAHGLYVTTAAQGQIVFGKYNEEDSNAMFIIGNGTDNTNRSNAFVIDGEGNLSVQDGFKIISNENSELVLSSNGIDIKQNDVSLASFTTNGAQIGQNASGMSRAVISKDGMQIYSKRDNTDRQIVNFGYSPSSYTAYYTLGYRGVPTNTYDASKTYAVGDLCLDESQTQYVCNTVITEPEAWNWQHWSLIIGDYSFAEGEKTVAAGTCAHAEGKETVAVGTHSHTEGQYTVASDYSHAEGSFSRAESDYSHAEGFHTKATGKGSHAQNGYTIAAKEYQTVIGKFNIEDTATNSRQQKAFIIGNGSSSARSNALTVDWNGNIIAQGMAGVIQMFAGSTAPTGWLICDGSAVSRTIYKTLYDVIGTTYGSGDGSTTFNLPDFSGRIPVGVGTASANTDGTPTNATAHTLSEKKGNEDLIVPYHRHGITSVLETNGVAIAANRVGTVSSGGVTYALRKTNNDIEGVTNTAYSSNDSTNATGANMMPYLTINYIICTGKTS